MKKGGTHEPGALVDYATIGLAIGLFDTALGLFVSWHSAFTSPGAWRLALHWLWSCGASCERVQRRECPIFFDHKWLGNLNALTTRGHPNMAFCAMGYRLLLSVATLSLLASRGFCGLWCGPRPF